MQTNVLPRMDIPYCPTGCCPEGSDGRHLHFEGKPFVRATTRGIMRIPSDMWSVFARVQTHVEDAAAQEPEGYRVFSRDISSSEGEHLFAVTAPVVNEEMTTLSGDFITCVFEGPYRNAKNGVHDTETAEIADGHQAKRIFTFYTSYPKFARLFGES